MIPQFRALREARDRWWWGISNLDLHVTNEFFWGQEGTCWLDTPGLFGLFLVEAENQRTAKRPRIPGLKVTCCAEAIKKIRVTWVTPRRSYGRNTFYIGTTCHTYIKTLWPPAPFQETRMESKPGLTHCHFLYRICYTITSFVQYYNSFIYVYVIFILNDWVHIPFCC